MKPAELLANRYEINLSAAWKDWLNDSVMELKLPGMMRKAVDVTQLCEPGPSVIWPGFMLPDTLPVLGNDYGDWICVRVNPSNDLGELIYWYHGGGDWIPVGNTMAEAVLHDAVDQFRPIRTQMIRSATESRIDTLANVLARLNYSQLRNWLGRSLPGDDALLILSEVIEWIGNQDHNAALRAMRQIGWCRDAIACDLIESYLQLPVQVIAQREYADLLDIPWFPDYINLLFDCEQASDAQRVAIAAAATKWDGWPQQDWTKASSLASEVLQRRHDLGWATAVCGWQQERSGQTDAAIDIYKRGVFGSAFTDQGVRLNSHAETDENGKFAAARLAHFRDVLALEEDKYIQLFLRRRERSLLAEVCDFWFQRAEKSESEGDFEEAYRLFYRAGWDMGVSRMQKYKSILSGLERCARQAGWNGMAKVAEAHQNCLPA
ncbi:MAG: SMI1/KNR4 family protein [Planctomycetota bacterium]